MVSDQKVFATTVSCAYLIFECTVDESGILIERRWYGKSQAGPLVVVPINPLGPGHNSPLGPGHNS